MFPNVGQLKKVGRDNNLYMGMLNFGDNFMEHELSWVERTRFFFPSKAGDYENQRGQNFCGER